METKLIYSDDARTGKGVEGDPVRRLIKLTSHSGETILKLDGDKMIEFDRPALMRHLNKPIN